MQTHTHTHNKKRTVRTPSLTSTTETHIHVRCTTFSLLFYSTLTRTHICRNRFVVLENSHSVWAVVVVFVVFFFMWLLLLLLLPLLPLLILYFHKSFLSGAIIRATFHLISLKKKKKRASAWKMDFGARKGEVYQMQPLHYHWTQLTRAVFAQRRAKTKRCISHHRILHYMANVCHQLNFPNSAKKSNQVRTTRTVMMWTFDCTQQ